MATKIVYSYYNFEQNTEQFFKWCLENELYKTSLDKSFKSHMKSCFEGNVKFDGLSAVIASVDGVPVGISICEHSDMFTTAKLMSGGKVAREHEWGFYHLGMLSIYVKEDFRNQGIATKLLHKIENIRLRSLTDIPAYHPLSIPLFQARELSHEIINKKSLYSYVSICHHEDYNYPQFLARLTHGIIESRYKEKHPMYPLRKRKLFHPEVTMLPKLIINTNFINKNTETTNRIKTKYK